MSAQRASQGFSGAVSEHIDRAADFDIDQDRAVMVSTTQREVVDTQQLRRALAGTTKCPELPQQRHPADRRPK